VDYKIKWENIDHLICDSDPYNPKLYKSICGTINLNIRLLRCWAHLLDLVSDTWQEAPLFSKSHILTNKFQFLMNKSSSTKSRYIQFLNEKKAPSVKSMPSVVLSR